MDAVACGAAVLSLSFCQATRIPVSNSALLVEGCWGGDELLLRRPHFSQRRRILQYWRFSSSSQVDGLF
jgi:hypothetical protein